MRHEPFSTEAVAHALRDATVASVEIVETFAASSAEVARLRVAFSDGRAPRFMIGKSATGAGLSAARRELRFLAQIAPLWAHPAPSLLGDWEQDLGESPRLLLLTEDLNAAGYASELKPGLGPHDLAYCLHAAPTEDRPARDGALLRRYWEGLQNAGIERYSWDLCQWDYRFSIMTNLFQAVFQDSLFWFRKTAALVDELDCRAVLRGPPPRS